MLILSVMTVIGGLGFNAMAKSSKKKRPAVRKVSVQTYTCGSDTIKVSYGKLPEDRHIPCDRQR